MRVSYIIIASIVALPALCASGFARPPINTPISLKAPYKSILLAYANHPGAGEQRYNSGHLVSVVTRYAPSSNPNVYLSNDNGQDEATLTFAPQRDSMLVQLIYGIADTPTHVLVTGRAVKNTGAITQFISGQNIDGTHPQVLHTGHFLAVQACQSDDHSLWAVGREMPTSKEESYSMLRHYTFTGDKLGSYVLNSSHKVKSLPILERVNPTIQLACRKNDVLFYDGLNQELTTYNSSAADVSTVEVKPIINNDLRPTGFAVDDDGNLFASWQQVAGISSFGSSMITRLEVSEKGLPAQWTLVSGSIAGSDGSNPAHLVGIAGHSLVTLKSGTNPETSTLIWSKVTDISSSE